MTFYGPTLDFFCGALYPHLENKAKNHNNVPAFSFFLGSFLTEIILKLLSRSAANLNVIICYGAHILERHQILLKR